MVQMYRTLRLAESDEGVLSVVIDAPPMNLIGPELVRDLVMLLGEVGSGQNVRVMVLESAADISSAPMFTAKGIKKDLANLLRLTLASPCLTITVSHGLAIFNCEGYRGV